MPKNNWKKFDIDVDYGVNRETHSKRHNGGSKRRNNGKRDSAYSNTVSLGENAEKYDERSQNLNAEEESEEQDYWYEFFILYI